MPTNNKCSFIGNFVENPKGSDVPDGKNGTTRVLKFRLGVNNRRTKKATFPTIEAWAKAAELIEQYCKKGDRIAVDTELVTDTWVDKETKENRFRDKYKLLDFEFISSKGGKTGAPEDDEDDTEEEATETEADEDEEEGEEEVDEEEEEEVKPAKAAASKGKRGGKPEPVAAAAVKGKGKGKGKVKDGDDDQDIPF